MREDEAILALAKELHRLYCNAVFKTTCPDMPALPALWESLSVHSQRFFIQFAKDVRASANGVIELL